jgi:hypothetical protein
MKLGLISAVAASLLGSLAACGGSTDPVPTPPATPDPAPPAETDAGVTPPPAVKPTACSAPLTAPVCATVKPAPTSGPDVSAFIAGSAVPLRCDDGAGGKAVWDLRPLIQLYGDQKMFMVGEVHGTNEIGILSSLLLEQLATKGLVNVVASELPMDFKPALDRYVATGSDPMAEQLLDRGAPNFFGAILTKTARALYEKGVKLEVGAVDIPYSPQTAVSAIQEVAAKLTAQKATVLDTLPTGAQEPPSADDIAKVKTYFDLIASKKTEICAELSGADCDRLDAMTHALWASTLTYDREGQNELWFERREVAIYYNMHALMPRPSDRMFLHMGAAHTNKHTFSAGSRMSKEYPLTKGQVFSVAPAYGSGSVIWYGQDQTLPGEPRSIVSSLTDAPAHPVFVSTTRPSAACDGNPVGQEPDDTVGAGGTRGQLYDGYIHYGKLTSERRPRDTKFERDGEVLSSGSASSVGATLSRVLAFRARIEEREREAIAAGVLTRRAATRR